MKYSNADTLYDKMSEPVKVCFLFPKIQSHLLPSSLASSSSIFLSLPSSYQFSNSVHIFSLIDSYFPRVFTFSLLFTNTCKVMEFSIFLLRLQKVISKSLFRLIQDLHFSLSRCNMFRILFSSFVSPILSTQNGLEFVFPTYQFFIKKKKLVRQKVLFTFPSNLIFKYLTEPFPSFRFGSRDIQTLTRAVSYPSSKMSKRTSYSSVQSLVGNNSQPSVMHNESRCLLLPKWEHPPWNFQLVKTGYKSITNYQSISDQNPPLFLVYRN